MYDLKVTLIQTSLYWEKKEANFAMFEEEIHSFEQETDLIVLPEMFTTGFTMNSKENADPKAYHTKRWMKMISSEINAAIMGSIIVNENGNFFNRLLFVEPSGSVRSYDKHHLFRMAKEHESFTPGDKKILINYKGWNIFPLICYDLRFPVWSRNVNNAFDCMITVANWPSKRSIAWNTLLSARAIENLCYSIGVNRFGYDENGIEYDGESAIYSPEGVCEAKAIPGPSILHHTLSKEKLVNFRNSFPADLDADQFVIS